MEFAKKAYFFTLDLLQTILLAASIFLFIYIFLYRPFQVSGDSMYPTFKNKEYIMTDLISLKIGDPVRGDVIVFKAPTDNEKDFIKRVIALPGDSIMVKDGYTYLNGKKLDESAYLSDDVRTYAQNFLHEGQSFTVPQGNYIVFGDNRRFSSDSREWGLLSRKAIIGRSVFVYWPVNVMRSIKNPFPPEEQK